MSSLSTIFSLQLALPLDPPLRQYLHGMIRATGEASTIAQKQSFYQSIARALAQSAPRFEYGVWDYFEDDAKARREFDVWADGINGKEARKAPAYGPGTRYMIFTAAFLLRAGSNTDRTVSQTCDLPEGVYWTRPTLGRMVSCMGWLNFVSVRSDLVYLVPGDDTYALTEEDLRGGDYEYLRKLA